MIVTPSLSKQSLLMASILNPSIMTRTAGPTFGVLDVTSGFLNYYVDTELSIINDISGFAQSITDLSGNVNTFIMDTSSKRPSILNDSAIGGKRVLRWDGFDDSLRKTNNATLNTAFDSITSISVFRSRTQALNGYLHMKGSTTWGPSSTTDGTGNAVDVSGQGQVYAITGLTVDKYRIWVTRKDGADNRTWINSIEVFPTISNKFITNNVQQQAIGSNNQAASRFVNMDLLLQAVWADPLSISDIIDLQDGLRERTGIAKVVQ